MECIYACTCKHSGKSFERNSSRLRKRFQNILLYCAQKTTTTTYYIIISQCTAYCIIIIICRKKKCFSLIFLYYVCSLHTPFFHTYLLAERFCLHRIHEGARYLLENFCPFCIPTFMWLFVGFARSIYFFFIYIYFHFVVCLLELLFYL